MTKWAVIGASSFSGRSFIAHIEALGERAAEFSLRDEPHEIARAVAASGATHVVNFAALNMVAESWEHAADYYRVNVWKTTAMIAALRAYAREMVRYVNVSTPEVYGATRGRLDEETPFRPSTPYAVSRAATDMHLAALHAAYGFPVVTARTVNVYGPGQQPYRIVPKTILTVLRKGKLQLHGGGVSERAFIHIRDHCEALRLIALRGMDGQTYHTSPQSTIQIRSLVGVICNLMGASVDAVVEDAPERIGKDPIYYLDDSKIRSWLGWSDRISLYEGLKETIGWFVEHADRFKNDTLDYTHRG